ncbi:hypothetical protein DEU56DRAFT_816983 [Suillus clintonianus]|uniref:uncharacterized protein n=1 Tax=Suillus clintonianus TaxID=1904413 RepID=UPI001B885EDD|nr:uncharacterized protein DEU56DRAFT_816983 [Suillus clintonianus]KAG2129608.1 hypothetical protein DEU56DRAFT_816983 [Suillus clintonianus]
MTFAKTYISTFNLAESRVSASDNSFELGNTYIDDIRLKREGEAYLISLLAHPQKPRCFEPGQLSQRLPLQGQPKRGVSTDLVVSLIFLYSTLRQRDGLCEGTYGLSSR